VNHISMEIDIYDGRDPRDIPAYSIAESARYLRLAPATLRSWILGRKYPTQDGVGFFKPLIPVPDFDGGKLSFSNLVEAHILQSLRKIHTVSIQAVRSAIQYAENKLKIDRLLLSKTLRASAGELFLLRYSELLNLSKSGQLALKQILQAYLQRVEWDGHEIPVRLYPFLSNYVESATRSIVIDPAISFGRPIIKSKSISTQTIVDRIDAGEEITELAGDYEIETEEIKAAIYYERAA